MYRHLRTGARRGGRLLVSGGRASLRPELEEIFDVEQLPGAYRAMLEANLRAVREYEPRPYPGRVTLIRARTRPLFHSFGDDLGWGEWAGGGVDVRCVPGDHASILDEPGLRILADHLRTAADQSQ
jgi:thioesterase domain-containing protein